MFEVFKIDCLMYCEYMDLTGSGIIISQRSRYDWAVRNALQRRVEWGDMNHFCCFVDEHTVFANTTCVGVGIELSPVFKIIRGNCASCGHFSIV